MISITQELHILFIIFIVTILGTVGFSIGSLILWAATIVYVLAPNKWYRDKRVRYIIVPVFLILAICFTILTFYSYEAAKYVFYLRLMTR